MKKISIIFTTLFLALSIMPVFALEVSGTVYDEILNGDIVEKEGIPYANVYAILSNGTRRPVAVADLDGKFTATIPDDAQLEISYAGHKPKKIENPGKNLNIKLEDTNTMQEVVSSACSPRTLKEINAKTGRQENGECVPETCIGEPNEYAIKNKTCIKVNCNSAEKTSLENAAAVKWENGNCVPTACIGERGEYQIKGDSCVKVNCNSDEKASLEKATDSKWNGEKCVPTACATNYHLNNKNKCVHDKCTKPEEDWDDAKKQCVQVRCSDEQISTANATNKSKWVNGKCEFACDTAKGYTLNANKTKCEQTLCSEKDAKRMIKNNVSKYELQNGVCIATDCISNDYEITPDRTACKNKKCPTPEEDVVNGQCTKKRCTVDELNGMHADDGYWDASKKTCIATKCNDKLYKLKDGKCEKIDNRSDEQRQKDLEEKRKAYEDAKANEQSTANKTLTALSTAATGIGGMELAQGLSEQSADKAAAADMAAYIETMRCTYGEGKQVKAGIEEIELPGANDQELMNLRGQYLALAQDLKERKDALGMKPGIESEEILDRSSTGIYDDENIGITGGNYASLYRAQVLESEADQEKIDDAKKTSKNRVIAGGVLVGVGVVGGIVGNQLINGNLGEKIKAAKEQKEADKNEKEALEKLQKCLKEGGAKKTSDLKFENFTPSVLHLEEISCSGSAWKNKVNDKNATTLFADTTDEATIKDTLTENFGCDIAGKLLDEDLCTQKPKQEQQTPPITEQNSTTVTVEQSAASQPSNTTQETDETKIRKCITEINKKLQVAEPDAHYLHIFNDTSGKYLMHRSEAVKKLSEKFKGVDDYPYVHDDRSSEALTPEEMDACEVLEKINDFIKNNDDWTE